MSRRSAHVRLAQATQTDDEVDTVVQPDVLIVCDPGKLDEQGMRGASDWVAEILSPTTGRYDQLVKLPAYEWAGVPEVWLVEPADRLLKVYRLEGGRYGPPEVLDLKGKTAVGALAGVVIDWERFPSA